MTAGSIRYPITLAAGATVSQTVYSLDAAVRHSRFPHLRQTGSFDAFALSPPNTSSTTLRGTTYVHLYGVGLMAALLALKRGYSREIAELAEITGMLHDLLCYVDRAEDTDDHAHKCADYAKVHVIDKLDRCTDEEKAMIYSGIWNHSDKHIQGHWFDEIIKDADALHHSLRNPAEEYYYRKDRTRQILEELL